MLERLFYPSLSFGDLAKVLKLFYLSISYQVKESLIVQLIYGKYGEHSDGKIEEHFSAIDLMILR